ncbi:MAG: hypothetical protein O3A00_03760 [Planctomycetota bacterium]|nr:hypothetical protein [Planctomycetota bacterium]
MKNTREMNISLVTVLVVAFLVYFFGETMERWMLILSCIVAGTCGAHYVVSGSANLLNPPPKTRTRGQAPTKASSRG